MIKFPFLLTFAERKINAVRVIDLLNNTFFKSHKISAMAVEQELSNIFHSMKYVHETQGNKEDIILRYNYYCNASIVCYNIGNHQDIFSGDLPSFKNKAVFEIPQYKISHKDEVKWDYSRGGGECVGKFYYALFDWSDIPIQRRAACIHHGIITPNDQVNIRDIHNYFINNPANAYIAPLIGYDIAQHAYEDI